MQLPSLTYLLEDSDIKNDLKIIKAASKNSPVSRPNRSSIGKTTPKLGLECQEKQQSSSQIVPGTIKRKTRQTCKNIVESSDEDDTEPIQPWKTPKKTPPKPSSVRYTF